MRGYAGCEYDSPVEQVFVKLTHSFVMFDSEQRVKSWNGTNHIHIYMHARMNFELENDHETC